MLAGIGIGLVPGLPHITLNPEIVFLVFLPPVLYAAAWTTSWADFKAAKRPITLLAIGCVIFTTCAVAWIAHMFIPGLGWPEAFVLGAIISPPDAVAATAATKGLAVPKRVTTILEGESLVNDATGLIAYKYAVAAVVSGSFVFWEAGVQFVIVATGGIALGLLVGYVFKWIHKLTPDNPTTDTTLTFLTPFITYLLAESIHVSGVLAVVVAGLFLSWNSSTIFSQQTRMQANGTWNTVIFLLNGTIFIFIGLQLPEIVVSLGAYRFPSTIKVWSNNKSGCDSWQINLGISCNIFAQTTEQENTRKGTVSCCEDGYDCRLVRYAWRCILGGCVGATAHYCWFITISEPRTYHFPHFLRDTGYACSAGSHASAPDKMVWNQREMTMSIVKRRRPD